MQICWIIYSFRPAKSYSVSLNFVIIYLFIILASHLSIDKYLSYKLSNMFQIILWRACDGPQRADKERWRGHILTRPLLARSFGVC